MIVSYKKQSLQIKLCTWYYSKKARIFLYILDIKSKIRGFLSQKRKVCGKIHMEMRIYNLIIDEDDRKKE